MNDSEADKDSGEFISDESFEGSDNLEYGPMFQRWNSSRIM